MMANQSPTHVRCFGAPPDNDVMMLALQQPPSTYRLGLADSRWSKREKVGWNPTFLREGERMPWKKVTPPWELSSTASISRGAAEGWNGALRKKTHVVRKKYHVVRKLFYVASIFGGAWTT